MLEAENEFVLVFGRVFEFLLVGLDVVVEGVGEDLFVSGAQVSLYGLDVFENLPHFEGLGKLHRNVLDVVKELRVGLWKLHL